MKIDKVLQRILKERNMKPRELARASGVPFSTLHEWMGGRSPRDPVQIKKVADALGVSLNRLLFDEADKNEPISITQILKDDLFTGTFEITLRRVRVKGGDQ